MRLGLVIAALGALCASAAVSDEAIIWKDDVRGWFIGVDESTQNGCFMTAVFNGGTALRVQFNPTLDVLQFMIGNDAWQSIEDGKLYPLKITFGSRSPWTGDGAGLTMGDLHMLVLDVPFTEGRAELFISEFKEMPQVTVEYEGRTVDSLKLTGTFAAMDEVIACQSAMNDAGPQSADPFSSGAATGNDPFQ